MAPVMGAGGWWEAIGGGVTHLVAGGCRCAASQYQHMTGARGRCCECCSARERTAETGKWVHRFKIAQGSWQAAGGLGRKARKNMMPEALQRELLQAAMK